MHRTQNPLRALLVFAVFCLLTFPQTALAADEKPGNIASEWIMVPVAGQEDEFEAALKAHVAWRKQAGDPFSWRMYQPVVGKDLTYYVIRSGGHHWADLDAEEAWSTKSKASEEFGRSVGPHVARYEHYLSEVDPDLSNWKGSESYKFYGVSHRNIKPGGWSKVKAAIEAVKKAAVEQSWTEHWAVSFRIGGHGGMSLVNGFSDYADMADPEMSAAALLAKSLGSEDAARAVLEDFGANVENTTYTVMRYRADLSTPE